MATLDRIINKNAHIAIRRASEDAQEKQERRISKAEIARRMTRRLFPKLSERADPKGFKRKASSMYRTLGALFSEEQPWRSDYIDAFCSSVGTVPTRLVADDYDASKVTEATRSRYLSLALGRRLSDGEVTKIVNNLNRELERPGMYKFITAIADALLSAPSKALALEDVSTLLLKTSIFDARPAKPKQKLKREKIS